MERKFVTFRVGEERYGIPIENVERILPVQYVTKVPKSPKSVLGVFDLRGSTVPAIDARLQFDLPAGGDPHNFVVVIHDDSRFAIQVDYVEGIIDFEESEIDEAANSIGKGSDALITGIGKKDSILTVLLNAACVAPEATLRRATKAA